MTKLIFSEVTLADIKKQVELKKINQPHNIWTKLDNVNINEIVIQQTKFIQSKLFNLSIHLFNEATVWGKAIYPLLTLAETKNIQAWAEVPLKAAYKNFSLEGTADGIMAESFSGYIETPYFIVVESKRGVKAKNPIPQLYAELLAAAKLNQQKHPKDSQQVFGCYTISDSWTFVQAHISKMDSKRPVLKIQTSREYIERYEAVTILKILKNILKQETHL